MGQFSWFAQDTNHRIVNDEERIIYLVDDKGNKWKENCYDGYGVFGGKDFYELLAEMNGYSYEKREDGSGYIMYPDGYKVLTDNVSQDIRHIGVSLAFGTADNNDKYYPNGDNPNIKWPSITESGEYVGGIPEADPDQGFPNIEEEDDDDWWCNDEDDGEDWL